MMIDELIDSAGADLVRIKNTRSRRHFLIGLKGRNAWMIIDKKKLPASTISELKRDKKLKTVFTGFVKWDKDEGVYVFHPRKAGALPGKLSLIHI